MSKLQRKPLRSILSPVSTETGTTNQKIEAYVETVKQMDSKTDGQTEPKKENKQGRMKTGYSLRRDLVKRLTVLAAVKETGANDLIEEGILYILDKYERS